MFKQQRLAIICYVDVCHMSQLGTTGDNPGATEVPGVQADEWPSRGAVCWGGVMFCAVTQITEIY